MTHPEELDKSLDRLYHLVDSLQQWLAECAGAVTKREPKPDATRLGLDGDILDCHSEDIGVNVVLNLGDSGGCNLLTNIAQSDLEAITVDSCQRLIGSRSCRWLRRPDRETSQTLELLVNRF